jgi:hypothetical protein
LKERSLGGEQLVEWSAVRKSEQAVPRLDAVEGGQRRGGIAIAQVQPGQFQETEPGAGRFGALSESSQGGGRLGAVRPVRECEGLVICGCGVRNLLVADPAPALRDLLATVQTRQRAPE